MVKYLLLRSFVRCGAADLEIKMKKKLFLLVTAFMIFALTGCGDVIVREEAKRRESTGESWTIMMYMCGSTLEEDYNLAGEVIKSLRYNFPENINVLVEVGGSRLWSVDDVSSDYIQDFEVQSNGLRLINQRPAVSMGESETLTTFLNWGIKEYTADHYMAILWGNGGGPIGGAAYDSLYNYDSLTLPELKTALSGIDDKLDIIGFDAGLMSNMETASVVSLYADYMVASEDIMPMSGWDYGKLFDFISNNPSAAAEEIGKIICDSAKEKASGPENAFTAMAVSDLSKLTMLTQAFEGMAQTMVQAIEEPSSLREIAHAMNELEHIGGNSLWEGYSNLIDVGELTAVVSECIGSPAANIANAINEVVVYKQVSEYHNTSSGLSVYYPAKRKGDEISAYKNIAIGKNYVEFIERICIDTEIPDRIYNFEDNTGWQTYNDLAYENTLTASADKNGRYILTPYHPEILTRAGVNFYVYSPIHSCYLYLCRDYNARYDASSGSYIYEFTGRLPKLNSTAISMYLVSQNTCFDIYSIPVVHEGELSNIRVSKSKQAEDYGEYRILGLWKGVDEYSGMADRKYRELKTGDVIIPLYEVYGENGNKYVEGNKIRIGFGGVKITDKLMGDGDYIVSYTAEDMYGISNECDTNNLTASKGKIKIMDY